MFVGTSCLDYLLLNSMTISAAWTTWEDFSDSIQDVSQYIYTDKSDETE